MTITELQTLFMYSITTSLLVGFIVGVLLNIFARKK